MLHKILLCGLLFFPLFSLWADDKVEDLPAGGRLGFHGMVVYGKGPHFLSHIPISGHHTVHNLQIIAQVVLKNAAGEKITPALIDAGYSLEPSGNFSLNDFAMDRNFNGETKTYKGTIYKGNFEDTDSREVFLANVSITVEKILVRRKLPPTVEEEAFTLGEGENKFIENKISPQKHFQKITYAPNGKILWCLNGPDFGPSDSCL